MKKTTQLKLDFWECSMNSGFISMWYAWFGWMVGWLVACLLASLIVVVVVAAFVVLASGRKGKLNWWCAVTFIFFSLHMKKVEEKERISETCVYSLNGTLNNTYDRSIDL